jgi:hypothetical protein
MRRLKHDRRTIFFLLSDWKRRELHKLASS